MRWKCVVYVRVPRKTLTWRFSHELALIIANYFLIRTNVIFKAIRKGSFFVTSPLLRTSPHSILTDLVSPLLSKERGWRNNLVGVRVTRETLTGVKLSPPNGGDALK